MLVPLLLDNLLSSASPPQPVFVPSQALPSGTSVLDIITGAMRKANILAAGENATPADSRDALIVFNDLLDSLSVDRDFIYTTVENIFQWNPGQYKYTIGNPIGGTFSGTLSQGSALISNVQVPANMVKDGVLSDIQGAIPANAKIVSFSAVARTVTMNVTAFTNVSLPETIQYTTPGDINIDRPLRIVSGYTRIPSSNTSGLDYWFDTTVTMDRYNELGYKGVPGPWPIALAYQPTFPLGTIWVYPNPNMSGEVHLFTDLILSQLTAVNQMVSLPQGYIRAFKTLLGMELCTEYGKSPSRELQRQAAEARAFIKALNASPVTTLRYDVEICRAQTTDAGWIISGGFT